MTALEASDEPVRRGRRGPYMKSEHTRRAILDAALEVFAESGFRSGSLRQVADRVGISEAGILHHFDSKKALLAEVLRRRDDQSAAEYPEGWPDPETALRALLATVETNVSTPGVVELFCTLAAEATAASHPAHAYFVARYDRTRASIEEVFAAMRDRGMLRESVDPATASRTVIAILDGAQLQWLLDRDSVDMVALLRSYLTTICDIEL